MTDVHILNRNRLILFVAPGMQVGYATPVSELEAIPLFGLL